MMRDSVCWAEITAGASSPAVATSVAKIMLLSLMVSSG